MAAEIGAAPAAPPGTPASDPPVARSGSFAPIDGSRPWEGQPRASGRVRLGALIAIGLAIQVLLATFVVLYVNFPGGYDIPAALSFGSTVLFRGLWPYPRLSFEPGLFARLPNLNLVLLWALYLAAWVLVQNCSVAALRRRMVVIVAAFGVLYHVGLTLFMPPILSADIYNYALFGRMVAFYGLNPYVTPANAVSGDLLWDFVDWRYVTTHYGPLWTSISAAVAMLGDHNALLTILLFKGVAAACSLANCLLIWHLARHLGGDGLRGLLLYAWNPLVLIETAGSGHNDAVMATFALVGLVLAVRGRLLLGLAALVLSVLVKYLTALLLLSFVLYTLARQVSRARALALAAGMGGITALLTAGFFLPFWAGPESLARLTTVGAPFKTLVRLLLRKWVAELLANGGDRTQAQAAAEPYVVLGLNVFFVLLLVLLARAALSPKAGWSRVLELWGIASLVYVMVVYGWNLSWFLIPPFATVCALPQTRTSLRLLAACHGFGFGLMFLYALPI